jgi:hypothetical protein
MDRDLEALMQKKCTDGNFWCKCDKDQCKAAFETQFNACNEAAKQKNEAKKKKLKYQRERRARKREGSSANDPASPKSRAAGLLALGEGGAHDRNQNVCMLLQCLHRLSL